MGASTSRVPHPEGASIAWHRTELPPGVSAKLHRKSDFRGALQTIGWLLLLVCWFVMALRCHAAGRPLATTAFALLYGAQANFAINGMHELGHGSVFRTRWLNSVFLRVISFIGWLHPDMFFSSHLRHHRYTQNAPHDQENPMPVILTWRDFLSFGFVNVKGCGEILAQTARAALGIYPVGHLGWLPGWERICYPPDKPAARTPAMVWAQVMLVGHLAVAVATWRAGWPLLAPLMLSFGPFYNGWMFWLCNSTQHVGLAHGDFGKGKVVADFRLSTRTFYTNPVVRFLYWHMSWHTEHHMYANVPCYHLAALHEAIKHDLPPTPNGIVECWRAIHAAVQQQAVDPASFQHARLPQPAQRGGKGKLIGKMA